MQLDKVLLTSVTTHRIVCFSVGLGLCCSFVIL